jgi:hypothetical protein
MQQQSIDEIILLYRFIAILLANTARVTRAFIPDKIFRRFIVNHLPVLFGH